MRKLEVGDLSLFNDAPFTLIAGPCQIEGREHTLMMAGAITEICRSLGVPLIFKASFDKANRTSGTSLRGVGIHRGLEALADVRAQYGIPVTTDVHTAEQCADVAAVVDMLQIPAFLCRQTDLLEAAGNTGKPVNIKKGQFMAPGGMLEAAKKVRTAAEGVMLTERGTCFGYNDLIVDYRGIAQMKRWGLPVCFDATHSAQKPGAQGASSGGDREMVPVLAKAAVAVGVAAVFMEVHDKPEAAPSDGDCMVRLDDFEDLLSDLAWLDQGTKMHKM